MWSIMQGIIESAIGYHNHIMDKYGDPRTKDWLFMSGPLPTVCMSLGYVIIVKLLGPKLMENRKPFELKKTMIVYNAFLVALNSWIVYEAYACGMFSWSLRCQPCDFSNAPLAVRVTRGSWWYYFSKFIEFIDTFIFVLRKKHNQISTLHVIHHAIMPVSVWSGLKFYPGGHTLIFGVMNSFVHVIMYSYYFLAALGPKVQKYLWWKKYLTTIQLIQFVCVFTHSFQLFFIECEVPILFAWIITGHALLFFVLFMRFYNEAYVSGEKKSETMMKSLNFCASAATTTSNGKTKVM